MEGDRGDQIVQRTEGNGRATSTGHSGVRNTRWESVYVERGPPMAATFGRILRKK